MVRDGRDEEGTVVVIEISCAEVWLAISEYIDDALDAETYERLRLHLENCDHCRAVYDGTRNTVALIGEEELYALPPGFAARLMRQLEVVS